MGDLDVLSAVRSFGPSLAWAVGRSDTGTVERPLALRWDGVAWTEVPTLADDARLYAVDGTGSEDVWAVGVQSRQPYALHWDGASWSRFDVPDPSEHASLHSVVALAPDDVWAVGHFHVMVAGRAPAAGELYQTLAVHFDGTTWSIVPSPNDPVSQTGLLFWLAPVDPADPVGGGLWSAGWSQAPSGPLRSLIERWDGSTWTVASAPRGPGTSLWGVTASSPGDAWATGYVDQGDGTTRPYALHWDGSAWAELATAPLATPLSPKIPEPALAPTSLWGVAAASDGSIWSVGAFTPVDAPSVSVAEHLCPIRVGDAGFAPSAAVASMRTDVLWRFDSFDAAERQVVDATGLGLFDSGLRAPGTSFAARYQAAGTYGVGDPTDGATGSIVVPLAAALEDAVVAVTWSAAPIGDLVFDVQVKRPGGTGFVPWETGTSSTGDVFVPDAGSGIYAFRSRLRDPVSGHLSGWSPASRVTVL